jgi:hypothetical protein
MEESEQFEAVGAGAASGVVPTFFVFLDLPRHVEFRAPDGPVLAEGTEVEFELTIRSTRDPRKTIPISGTHVLHRRVLRFGGKRPGLSQYLEWKSVPPR